jgi:cytochrome c oxidase accessory protein FixG
MDMDEQPPVKTPTEPPPASDYRSVLASVDRDGRRKWIYAAIIPGWWRKRRNVVSTLLIVFYLALPFLRVNGEPLLRFDLVNKYYVVFGYTFWPQDFFFLLLAVLAGVITTLLLVSLLGRVFCGWICPHNVFLEGVFRRIETWCEGPAHKRRIQDQRRPWPLPLVGRKILKWIAYLLMVGAMANTATALFIGPEDFIGGIIVDPIRHPTGATFFTVFFALNLFNFAWFREQTCTIVCPYGRWQAALLDPDTVGVTYDYTRGEPRGKKGSTTADCVDCFQCVNVCPTGIDIRDGNQLECIQCTACIDACDSVMTKLDRPKGLIRFTSENALKGAPLRIVRPRGAIYAAALTVIIAIGLVRLSTRTDVMVTRLRDTAAPTLSTDESGNQTVTRLVHIALLNRARTERRVHAQLPPDLGATIFSQFEEVVLQPNERREIALIVNIPRDRLPPAEGHKRLRIETTLTLTDNNQEVNSLPLTLEAP